MFFITILVALISLTGCQKSNNAVQQRVSSAPWITKDAVLYDNRCESTPVMWTDGSQLDIVWHRNASVGEFGTSFDIIKEGQTLSQVPFAYGFISALVSNGSLYVFGTSADQPGNAVYMVSSSDLQTWSTPTLVVQCQSPNICYNSSVASDSTGFVMASERCVAGDGCVHVGIAFYHSTDLLNWTEISSAMYPGSYTGAPAIRYSNGYYYVAFMSNGEGYYYVSLARSPNLQTWENAKQAVLSPDESQGEGYNASDIDLVDEGNGVVKILYAIGMQVPGPGQYMNIREATYQGTLQSFFEEFYK